MKDGIWIANNDNEIEYIRELVSENKTSITYINQHDERVCIDKNYFKTYQELLAESRNFKIGDFVQIDSTDDCYELVEVYDTLYVVTNGTIYKSSYSCRKYNKNLISIEKEMNK